MRDCRVLMVSLLAGWVGLSTPAMAESPQAAATTIAPGAIHFSQVINGKATVLTYRGRPAVQLVPAPEAERNGEDMLAILQGIELRDGTIEVEVAGAPRTGAPADSRGFIGIAFRVKAPEAAELIYLRPTNGRSDDQLRRNHSVQYQSYPDFPWYRLRSESPGVYESYVDLESGEWTKMRIVVAGTTARLYVNSATQPCLVVNDLKRGVSSGQIALWAHVETDAFFGGVTVRQP